MVRPFVLPGKNPSKDKRMPSKTAVEEIEGRIELIGKKIAEARREAIENREWAQRQDESADELTRLRDEYIGLLEDSGAR